MSFAILIICGAACLISIVTAIVTLQQRRQTQARPQAPRRTVNPSPHEEYPEILHWQKGDQFDAHVKDRGKHYYGVQLISLTADGYAYCQDMDQRVKVRIASLIGHNESVVTRMVNSELQNTNDYMALIEEFNKAYAELQERDKKLKLVS